MIPDFWDVTLRNWMNGSRCALIFKSALVCFLSQQADLKKVVIRTSLCILPVLNPYSDFLGLCYAFFPNDYQDSAFKICTTS